MKFGWRGALGILLSAGFLYFAFKDIELSTVLANLKEANLGLLVLSAVVATCIFPLRAIRWRPILDPVAPNLPFRKLWSATAIGMMINNVVPARAGELARAYALSRSAPEVPFPAALASLAVDRLFDLVVLLLLMFLAMLDPAFPSAAQIDGRPVASYAMGGVFFAVGILVAMYLMVLYPAKILALFERVVRAIVPRKFAPRIESSGRDAILALSRGLSVLKTPGRFLVVLLWTIAHWVLNGVAFWIAFKAVGVEAPFSASLFLQGLIAFGVAIPQAPGFFGVFETLGKVGLALYGVPADKAVTWAVGFHAVSYLPITLIGAWYFLRAGLSVGDIGRAEQSTKHPEPGSPSSAPAAPRP